MVCAARLVLRALLSLTAAQRMWRLCTARSPCNCLDVYRKEAKNRMVRGVMVDEVPSHAAAYALPGGASAGEQPAKPPGIWKRALTWLEGVLPSTSTVAPGDVNRWMMVPPAVATHLCLGSVFAWSLFNDPLSRELGVVAACSSDWHLGSIVPVFSTVLALHGLTAAAAGLWQQRAGVRASNTLGALCWGGGLMLGGAGVYVHSLPLLYAGFGLLGGIGQGLAYVPPIATLIRWFPDKKGLAGGARTTDSSASFRASIIRSISSSIASSNSNYNGNVQQATENNNSKQQQQQ